MQHARMIFRTMAAALLGLLTLCACDDDGDRHEGDEGGAGGLAIDEGDATFEVRESLEQLYVWRTAPGTQLELRNAAGDTLQLATTDHLGSHVFRQVPPGEGYVLRTVGQAPAQHTRPLTVRAVEGSEPPQSFYDDQRLRPGFNYLTVRDGTQLSVYVTLPGPPELGPYPTVVNYSGYDPSRPGEPINGGQLEALCPDFPTLCDAPADASALIASFMGYATVGVNVRGTGCSGGAYDFFEPLQLTDGYDAIEIVAAQPWVKGHRVGMTGLSYPGITQLFVGRTNPPSLAGIAPLSVIGDTASTLYPGGILNNGFALLWADRVHERAAPYGQGWEQARVDGGDPLCAENQLLHDQRIDIIEKARNTPFYDPVTIDPLNPTIFVHEIAVPVFLGGAFHDEQTGPYFTTLLDQFTGAPLVRLTVYNGVHVDGFSPQLLGEWKAFLDFHVAQTIPTIDPGLRNLGPLLFQEIFDVSLQLPPDRFTQYASFEEAKAAYEAEPSLRVLFENGGGDKLGAPEAAWEHSFPAWPPVAEVLRLHLQPDGTLADAAPPAASAASAFLADPYAGDRGILGDGPGIWATIPAWDWQSPAPGASVVFEGAALTEDLVMVGTGSVDLWLRSEDAEADLEVTLSEVRPDGLEVHVQTGWLRASHRHLSASATELWPAPTHLREDFAPLVPGEWVQARVAIPGFSHPFRAGSRIRLEVDTPGGSRAEWRFQLFAHAQPTRISIGHDATHASSIALPVIAGLVPPTPLPPCPSLRGQPCRSHVPYVNVPE